MKYFLLTIALLFSITNVMAAEPFKFGINVHNVDIKEGLIFYVSFENSISGKTTTIETPCIGLGKLYAITSKDLDRRAIFFATGMVSRCTDTSTLYRAFAPNLSKEQRVYNVVCKKQSNRIECKPTL